MAWIGWVLAMKAPKFDKGLERLILSRSSLATVSDSIRIHDSHSDLNFQQGQRVHSFWLPVPLTLESCYTTFPNGTISAASASMSQSMKSLGHIHNETGIVHIFYVDHFSGWSHGNAVVNIYSHLLGGILFFTLPIYVYSTMFTRYRSAQIGDIIVFSTFLFGVAICFLLSAL